MHIFQAILLGIVEGLTEFLPISSTAHLILAGDLLSIPETEFVKSFEIFVQLGAIAAVAVLYIRRFLSWPVLTRLFVGSLPLGILGLVFYKAVKMYLLGNVTVVLWALLVGGVALVVFDHFHHEKKDAIADFSQLSYGKSFAVGCFQVLALIPGVSRSGATIIGGLLFGLQRRFIVEFSFLLAVPVMVAASGLDLVKSAAHFSGTDYELLAIGFVVSFVTALGSIRFFLSYIRRHSFRDFGLYRILLAVLFFLFY